MKKSETLVKIIAMEIRQKRIARERKKFPERFIEKSLEKKSFFSARSYADENSSQFSCDSKTFSFFFSQVRWLCFSLCSVFAIWKDKSRSDAAAGCDVAREHISQWLLFHPIRWLSFFFAFIPSGSCWVNFLINILIWKVFFLFYTSSRRTSQPSIN